MSDLFLLGAGASVNAQVPDSYEMTKKILEKFSNGYVSKQLKDALYFVVGGLLFKQGIGGNNPFDGVNIEDVLNTVATLADRKNSDVGPFIGTWHPRLNELESGEVTDTTAYELVEELTTFLNRMSSWRYKDLLTRAVREVTSGSSGRLFDAISELMTRKLIELVWVTEQDRISYLLPLVEKVKDSGSSIATLNYDNTIELACQSLKTEFDTGFESWSQTGEFTFRDNSIPLIKLHGSIDWMLLDKDVSRDKPLAFQAIEKVDPNSQKEFVPAILFGGKNKLTAKGPFLNLLRAFEKKLSISNRLIVIGYSFRDDHVNEYIAGWFNGNQIRKIVVLDPRFSESDEKFVLQLRHTVVQKGRVIDISEGAETGIPRLINILERI